MILEKIHILQQMSSKKKKKFMSTSEPSFMKRRQIFYEQESNLQKIEEQADEGELIGENSLLREYLD